MMHFHRSFYRLIISVWIITMTSICASAGNLIEIQGDISSITFQKEQSPYVVINDIEIPENVEIIIPPGVVLLFKNSTTFYIQGKLIAKGTPDLPIVFTSYLDPQYSPEQYPVPTIYDWIGIQIAGTSKHVIMQHVQIKYSKFPVETLTPTIKFEDVQFIDNMNSRLRINDQNYDVKPKSSFFYPLPDIPEEEERIIDESPSSTLPPAPVVKPSLKSKEQPVEGQKYWWKHIAFRVSVASLAAAAAGASAYLLYEAEKHADNKDTFNSIAHDKSILDNGYRLYAEKQRNDEAALESRNYKAATAGFIVSGCFLTGGGVSFILPIKSRSSKALDSP